MCWFCFPLSVSRRPCRLTRASFLDTMRLVDKVDLTALASVSSLRPLNLEFAAANLFLNVFLYECKIWLSTRYTCHLLRS